VIGSIINRLILMELLKVFFLALCGLTGLFLIAGLIQEAAQRGLSFFQVVTIIPLLIPNMLPYTIPATTLFATCVVYGRMSHDNEIIVLKAAGVNILNILKPAVLLGVSAGVVTMYLYLDTIPRTQRLLREKVLSDAEDVLYVTIKREGMLRQPGMDYVMYVREVQGKRLLDVVFKKRLARQTGRVGYEVVARAREARLEVDQQNEQIRIVMGRCTVVGEKDGVGADVYDRVYPIPMPASLGGKDWHDRVTALTWPELHQRLDKAWVDYQESLRNQEECMLRRPGRDATKEQLDNYDREVKSRVFEINHHRRFYYTVKVEIHLRPALSAGCLCFVLIGCPVGIWASRSDYLSIFVICFLPTLFIYYPVLLACMNMAKDAQMNTELAVWSANGLLAIIALYMIRKLMAR
jgi:lipopolysaccharide export system permease protein